MKFQPTLALALSASTTLTIAIPTIEQLYTLELAPGGTIQVTEAGKWNLLESNSAASNATRASTDSFIHPNRTQNSIIATIHSRTNSTIIVSAHLDSFNMFDPLSGRAPGADDDGSVAIAILEILRVLLTDERVRTGQAEDTIEFHWYAAEEAGLFCSQAVFVRYWKEGRVVKAMLQPDMVRCVEDEDEEAFGVVTDYVDTDPTTFVKKVIEEYCTMSYIETECRYACSDHESALKADYPSAFVIESAIEDTSGDIHFPYNTVDEISFSHILEHVKMTVEFAYELGFASEL